jgi:hypothetical protein
VVELRRDPDLAQEALGADRRGDRRLEDLDRHRAVVPLVVREVDGRHAAGTDLPLEAVAPSQRLGQAHYRVGHPRPSHVPDFDILHRRPRLGEVPVAEGQS